MLKASRRPPLHARAAFFLALCCLAQSGAAYGPFKERTQPFEWKILRGAHFDVYFYPEEEPLARRASAIAEGALAHDAKTLDYYPKARQPLFLFQNHIDFQQTNISREVIGPGTGGFTEAFKNRMVLPTTQSDKWLDVVITHELAHAIQFNVLYGEGQRSFQVFKNYVIPLWVMEGMAEYCAQNWDSFADMVLRDAVLNERVPDLDLLDGFSHLDEVYVAYKAGQTAVQFLADSYGPDSVAKLLKKYKAQISTEQIIKELTGRSAQAFNRDWKASLRQKYWLQAKGKKSASAYGSPLTWDDSDDLATNNGPAWSPDGQRLAFVSSVNQREEIWVMDADGRNSRVLFGGPFEELGRSGGYGVPGGRMSWSPDGTQLAVVIVRHGAKRLVLLGLEGGERELDLPLREIAAPAFSPDGRSIAFSGAVAGVSQLYTVDLSSGKMAAVTRDSDVSLVTDPAWSPDGLSLAYSAEDGRVNQVFVVGLDGNGRRRLSKPGVDSLMPAFEIGGRRLFYCTEDGGGYNLARVDLDGKNYERFTDLVSGAFHPRPSPDGRWLAFVAYEDGCQNLYRMEAPGYVKEPPSPGLQALINPYKFAAAPATPSAESLPVPPSAALAVSGTAGEAFPLPDLGGAAEAGVTDTAALPVDPYQLKISPDLFFMLLGYDSLNGLVGGGYLTASDMVGDHNLSAFVNFVPGYQSVFQVDYMLMKGPVNVGVAAFYRNTNFFLSNINPQTVSSTFLDQDWGGTVSFQKPFSKFTRLDLTLGSRRLLRELNGDAVLDAAVRSTLGESYINSISLGVVRDTFTYKNYDTYGGYRLSLSTSYSDKFLGGTRNFVYHQAELRVGLPLTFLGKDTVLQFRALGLDQSGEDRQLFYFGGVHVRGLSYNEYLGQKMALGNVQIRTPYLKRINGTLWPLESLLIKDVQIVGYYDVGIAPDHWENVVETDVRAGYGGGLRMHSFLFEKAFVLLAFDIAQRTDKPGGTYYYFTLGQIF
jgi:WD40 repeat protein